MNVCVKGFVVVAVAAAQLFLVLEALQIHLLMVLRSNLSTAKDFAVV
jgi:hypothetical protein